MSTIVQIHGREILDSRGNPTIEVKEPGAGGLDFFKKFLYSFIGEFLN